MDINNAAPHVQARLFTKQSKFKIPSHPLSLQITVTSTELLSLAKSLIAATELYTEEDLKGIQFDFLINGEYLRDSLQVFFERHSLSTENVVEIECVERLQAPEPEDSLQHDDWVAAVRASGAWILSGCYDNTVKLWDIVSGSVLSTIPGHSAPVKCVAWIEQGSKPMFVSGSQDGTVLQWQWNAKSNTVDCLASGHGHAGSVDALAVTPSGSRFASGSWDKMLKIWSTGGEVEDETAEKPSKKKKSAEKSKIITRVPLMTLSGHREGVSSVQWLSEQTVCTASWDHSIRLWDIERAQETSCLNGSKAVFSISYSPLNQLTISASADRHVRLHDHRANEGSMVKATFTSHTGWVSSVCWCSADEHFFVSGSYDGTMKLWDTRSPNTSLYDMSGHDDKILSVDWSVAEYMVSGGADSTVKIYKHATSSAS